MILFSYRYLSFIIALLQKNTVQYHDIILCLFHPSLSAWNHPLTEKDQKQDEKNNKKHEGKMVK